MRRIKSNRYYSNRRPWHRYRNYDRAQCYNCGRLGHWAVHCADFSSSSEEETVTETYKIKRRSKK